MKFTLRRRIDSALLLGILGTFVGALPVPASTPAAPADTAQQAEQILETTGFHGGVILHVGCGDGALTAALAKAPNAIVQGLDQRPAAVLAARQRFQATRLAGRVTARQMVGGRLPVIDNTVNLLVIEEPDAVAANEVLRVLCPNGTAYMKTADGQWQKTVKPRPQNIDDWSHYLHDASNNAVAHDDVVSPPTRLQWSDGPTYARHHDRMSSVSAVVAANGRVFEIIDLAPPLSILLPPRWTLRARDAFNGTRLWQRSITHWFTHLWPLKSGPAVLPRRLVAAGDRVYVTLAIDGPLSQLDATTGATLQTYANTETTEEVLYHSGVLYLVVNPDGKQDLPRQMAQFKSGYKASIWEGKPRRICAIDAETGTTRWSVTSVALPGTLATNGERVVFHNGDGIVCLDAANGAQLWQPEPVPRASKIMTFYLPTLVLYQDVVLFSGGETAGLQTGSWYRDGKDSMTALSLQDGKKLWSAPHPPSGYRSAEDLLVANGLVWTGETTSGRAEGRFTGRDPHSGAVTVAFEPDVSTYWFHHRCYRGKATDNYLLMARAGTEFIDVRSHHWDVNYWVRGACLYGIMPANGLLYAPPQPCACYQETKLHGFNAVAGGTGPRVPAGLQDTPRLVKGPAYGNTGADVHDSAGDWPTLRHDGERSGRASTQLAAEIQQVWKTSIGGKLTSPVSAGGRVFVASIDTHTLHTLDAKSGKALWQFTAGGRIDSPPTVYKDCVLFGAADGFVYCLRAQDGELVWQFRAAPIDEQLVSFQQFESVWPVHGNILVQNDVAYFVAGRSMFLDGGLHLWRLNPTTGAVLSHTRLDDKDPITGKTLEQFVSWLNMPPALSDVLSSDGKYIYMRSQPLTLAGQRVPLKPIPHGPDADQGAPEPTQDPEFAHLFSPTGLLDDSWWHRTYWMYGNWFVSGWAGYFLSGRVAPAGRIMSLANDNTVYAFGRKPQYFRWTVPMEYHLYAADKFPPPAGTSRRAAPTESWIELAKSPALSPAKTAITIAAWINSERPVGVVAAHGGGAMGYALYLQAKHPSFTVRVNGKATTIKGNIIPLRKWVHLAAVLDTDLQMRLFVDGTLVAQGKAPSLIPGDPAEGMTIGSDEGTTVGDYAERFPFGGVIDEVQVYHCGLNAAEIGQLKDGKQPAGHDAQRALQLSFADGKAIDGSPHRNQSTLYGVSAAAGKVGEALRFTGTSVTTSNYKVAFHWTKDLPILARAMVLVDGTLYVAGPPDVMDEEQTYRRADTPASAQQMQRQLSAVNGKLGAKLIAVSTQDGTPQAEYSLTQPPVFDGMAAADGRLVITTIDGDVECWK